MIGSIHPSPGMNKRLFINTPYWEFLNEMIPVSRSRGGEEVLCDSKVANLNPCSATRRPYRGHFIVHLNYLQFVIVNILGLQMLLFPGCSSCSSSLFLKKCVMSVIFSLH